MKASFDLLSLFTPDKVLIKNRVFLLMDIIFFTFSHTTFFSMFPHFELCSVFGISVCLMDRTCRD